MRPPGSGRRGWVRYGWVGGRVNTQSEAREEVEWGEELVEEGPARGKFFGM